MTIEEAKQILGGFRCHIDEIDNQILHLLNRRAAIAVQIGDTKHAAGLPVVELSREEAVIQRMIEASEGPLSPEAVKHLYTTIMQEMRRLQARD
jgi:chorismate mutase